METKHKRILVAIIVVLVMYFVFTRMVNYTAVNKNDHSTEDSNESEKNQSNNNNNNKEETEEEKALRKQGINAECQNKMISYEEVAKHKTCGFSKENDFWLLINGYVYDASEFLMYHPGGDIICSAIGMDATATFKGIHHGHVIEEELPRFCIGKLADPENIPKKN